MQIPPQPGGRKVPRKARDDRGDEDEKREEGKDEEKGEGRRLQRDLLRAEFFDETAPEGPGRAAVSVFEHRPLVFDSVYGLRDRGFDVVFAHRAPLNVVSFSRTKVRAYVCFTIARAGR